jgi:Domain of unknown function (DUF6249)
MRAENAAVFVMVMTVSFAVLSTTIVISALTLRFRRRELQHKERLAAIERGAPLPDVEQRAPWTPRVYLLRGMMWLFSGIGLTLFLAGYSASTFRAKSVEERALVAQRLKDLGAADEQVRQVQSDATLRRNLAPGFALIGLVPIGVRLAYLLTYRVEIKKHTIST